MNVTLDYEIYELYEREACPGQWLIDLEDKTVLIIPEHSSKYSKSMDNVPEYEDCILQRGRLFGRIC